MLELKSRNESAFDELDAETKENLVNSCVRFLVLEGCLSRKPIKKDVLRKVVFKGFSSALVPAVVKEAQLRLKQLFGFELAVARKPGEHGGDEPLADGPDVDDKSWFLKNTLKDPGYLRTLNSLNPAAAAKRALATVVLALIFINKKVIGEEALWQQLQGIDSACAGEGIKKHPEFGDVTKLVSKTFVEEKLLVRKTSRKDDGETAVEYRIGARALAEIGALDIAEFAMQLTGQGSHFKPEDVRQWAGALAEAPAAADDGEDTEMEDDGSDDDD